VALRVWQAGSTWQRLKRRGGLARLLAGLRRSWAEGICWAGTAARLRCWVMPLGRAGVRARRAGRLWATLPAEADRKERGKENLFFL